MCGCVCLWGVCVCVDVLGCVCFYVYVFVCGGGGGGGGGGIVNAPWPGFRSLSSARPSVPWVCSHHKSLHVYHVHYRDLSSIVKMNV